VWLDLHFAKLHAPQNCQCATTFDKDREIASWEFVKIQSLKLFKSKQRKFRPNFAIGFRGHSGKNFLAVKK
jgi:hypothetical protein